MTGPGDGSRERAMRFVVNSLAAKAQSVSEIERKLAQRGVPPDLAGVVIADARALGYLDDAELAGQLARGYRERGYGQRRAAAAMRHRGLSHDDAATALAAAFGGTDETALAVSALGSRRVEDAKAERRAVAFLVRRGFSGAAAWAAVRQRTGDA